MARKVPPGLVKRGSVWYIWKTVGSKRVRESCGTSDLAEAERFLAHRMEEIRKAEVYGVRPRRTFRKAATKYLAEATKASIDRDVRLLKVLDPFIGDLALETIHMGKFQSYVANRRAAGWKTRTINYGLQVVRHVLNLATNEWVDEHGLTWLAHAPRIKLLTENDRSEPYPLDWREQERLFRLLPVYLRRMSLFAVNTGCRDQEICKLRWDWEVEIPELETSVFIIPKEKVKNREDRLVVLNSIARAVIEEVRGDDPEFVFTYQEKAIQRMYNRAWRQARERAGLPTVRVHDLKHTFGRRLRAAGVMFEDRQDLLGHKSNRVTTDYSAPELINLIQASERVCHHDWHKSGTMVILKKKPRLAVVNN